MYTKSKRGGEGAFFFLEKRYYSLILHFQYHNISLLYKNHSLHTGKDDNGIFSIF